MGAAAFQKGLGAMHALAHPLGGVFDAHHGMLNAILMPYVLIRNREVLEDKLERVSAFIGLLPPGADKFIEAVLALRESIGIPKTLAEIGIDRDRARDIAMMAVEDPSALTNPIDLSVDDYQSLLLDAIDGNLRF
jgi:hypothetical protein